MKKTLKKVTGTIAGLAVIIVLLGSVVVTNENEYMREHVHTWR